MLRYDDKVCNRSIHCLIEQIGVESFDYEPNYSIGKKGEQDKHGRHIPQNSRFSELSSCYFLLVIPPVFV